MVLERGNDLVAQRVILPAWKVRRPDAAGLGPGDAGHADADRVHTDALGLRAADEFGDLAYDQFAEGPPLPVLQTGEAAAQHPPPQPEKATGQLRPAQVNSNDGHAHGDDSPRRAKCKGRSDGSQGPRAPHPKHNRRLDILEHNADSYRMKDQIQP